MRRLLLWLALKIVHWRHAGKTVTLLKDYGDGEPEEVFTGVFKEAVTRKIVMSNGKTGIKVEIVVEHVNPKYGFVEVEYINMLDVKWNRTARRLEAQKSEAKAATRSSSSTPRTSGRASSLQLPEAWRSKGGGSKS